MWTIHQPKPRAASPRTLRYLIVAFILLLTFTYILETFSFLNEPPGPQQSQLPTPSSTPEPKPSIRRLGISDLVLYDDHFGNINTLQTAVDTLEKAGLPGNAVLTFDQTSEGEYLLSAKPWEAGQCRQLNQELWDQLEGHARVPPTAPVHEPAVQPAALYYLTPPSSPEPVRKHDLAPIEHLDPPNAPGSSCADLFSTVPTDQPSNEDLEYISDYDYDGEWAAESIFSDTEELPAACTPAPTNHSDCPRGGLYCANTQCSLNPSLPPSGTCDTFPLEKSTMCLSTNSGVKNLTSQLDKSCFSEWPIARGGFGEIWKGALTHGKPIAVKRLTMYSAAGDEGVKKIRKRTDRELAIWSCLKHPNILPLMGTCSFRGSMGLVSEWQENGNAIEWVRANPGVDRLELCGGICTGLAYLHEHGIVHGDLRGANVMISKEGAPRLIDFGLASITDDSPFSASSTLAGTLRWMAPELQVTEGQGTTKAGDIFAFGMTMLELFTGLPPFSAVKNDIAVLLKYQKGERPPRPSSTWGKTKSSEINRATRLNVPRGRGGVCEPMDNETWCEVQKCWDQDPCRRPLANGILEWFMRKRKRKCWGLDKGLMPVF